MTSKILIGCDPEIFVTTQTGEFISAHGMIPGNKKNPHVVPQGAVQVDGMALEFNINPAHTHDEFVGSVKSVLATLASMVPEYQLAPVPVAHFPLEYIKAQPEEARELGCDPDFNAYTGNANIKPNADLPMRTASGHIHIGWTDGADALSAQHVSSCHAVARQCDVILGLASLFYDDDVKRRSMYGQAGCVRYKSYGVEYRTLSNAWLRSEERMSWVYRNTMKAMDLLFAGRPLFNEVEDVATIINTSDKKRAEAIIKKLDLEMVA